ncbi:MAG TPA: serine/threonine-protein kinase, partial [Aggregatilineales bacterium]|nr:serine/threonine-protein kinase [Aggregatilineales bacterium]
MANPTALIGNRYQLHEQLGAGGMGVVYRATDRLTGKIVALKRVSTPRNETAPQTGTAPPTEGDPTTATVRRIALAREFQVLASLRHPNVISVLDYGFDDERRPYFTMTLLDRPQTILQAGRRLSLEKKVDLLIQLLQALAYLHRRGILHRDLKPGNVLVERGARLRVLDFGLASPQEVADSVVAGTLTHLAPELLARGVPSQASDLYAVGMIAYELFTYRYPFDRSTITSLLDQILLQEPDFTPLLALRPNLTTPVAVPDDAADLVSDTARRPTPPDGVAALSESDDTLIMDIDPAKVAATWRQENPDKPTADTELPSPLQAAPPRLIDVVQKLLRKRPEERYQDASSVIADLCLAIGQPVVAESDAQRESFLQSAQFVGRDAELSELTSALDAAVDGHGSAWLIGGESGIGKSRLMDELAIRALVQGVIVLRGQGVAGGGVPYQLWRDPLRRLILSSEPTDREASVLKELVPEIGTLLGRDVADAIELTGQSGRLRLFTVIVNLFQRQRAPLLMVLEDLHWARRSLDVLNRVIP